jgi:aminoglycoside phosphotransferase (APT) family kinase protein
MAGLVAALPDRASPDDAGVVRAAWRTLPAWVRGGEPAPGPVGIVHGDWHLGQLVAPPGDGWRLADVDDLGSGAPVWDFARLAALRALGVVREDEFRGFLDAYWAAGGPALRRSAGWDALDAVARAQVVSAAARRLGHPDAHRRYPDGLNGELLRVCARLAAGAA